MLQKTYQISQFLESILDPELQKFLEKIHNNSSYYQLPDDRDTLKSPMEVSRIVAITANKYFEATRLAGIVRARFKIAEANYKYKYRTNLTGGKNAAEREAKAAEAAQEEYEYMIYMGAIVELAESVESSSRIASESARRMLLGSQQSQYAQDRFDGHSDALTDKDFSTY